MKLSETQTQPLGSAEVMQDRGGQGCGNVLSVGLSGKVHGFVGRTLG